MFNPYALIHYFKNKKKTHEYRVSFVLNYIQSSGSAAAIEIDATSSLTST